MFDTISIGSATLDLFFKSKDFELSTDDAGVQKLSLVYGSKLSVDHFAMQSGGGGTNTAVGFARMGFRASVIAEVGQDMAAESIIQELKKENVDTQLLVQEHAEETGISALLIAADGGRSVVTARGAAQMLTVDDVPFDTLDAHWIHLSSVGNLELIKKVAQFCKKKRIRMSWNPGGSELKMIEEGTLHLHEVFPTVFCVNDEEAAQIEAAGYDLTTAGGLVIVTTGNKGGRYYEHGKWQTFAPADVEVVQATGAGDAFITGVASAYLYDRRTEEAIQWGVKNAGSVIQHMGAKTGLLKGATFHL